MKNEIDINIEKRGVDSWYGCIRLENGEDVDVFDKSRVDTIKSLSRSMRYQIECLINALIELEKEK